MEKLTIVVFLTEPSEPVLTYDLVVEHCRHMFVGAKGAIGTQIWLVWVVELADRSVWVEAKIVLLS